MGLFGRKKESNSTKEPEIREPVSVKRQTVYAFIPILNLLALFKIEKFWKGIGIYALVNITSRFLAEIPDQIDPNADEILVLVGWIIIIIIAIGLYLIPVHFVRKWSKQWNEKIKSENS